MSQFPKPNNEYQRLEALKSYNISSDHTESGFDFIMFSIASICEVSFCNISLVNENDVSLVSTIGLGDIKTVNREDSLSQYAILEKGLLEIKDTQLDSRSKSITHIGDHVIRFYAGYPLIDNNGHALGSINIYDQVPRSLNEVQKYFIQQAAENVTNIIVRGRERQEAQQYEKLFRIGDSLVGIVQRDGTLVKVNPACSKLFGWSVEELLNKPIEELIHPDDLQTISTLIKGEPDKTNLKSILLRVLTKTNEIKYIDGIGLPEEGTDLIYFMGRDMTSLFEKNILILESDKRFRAFFENSQSLMCMHDLQGRFISVNKSGVDMVGYRLEDINKMSLYDIIPAENHKLLNDYLNHILEYGRATGKMLIKRKDGGERIWLFNNVLENDEHGNTYIIGNAVDITEQYRLEKELEDAKKAAENANKAKSAFLANMSHEIRTPINGIIGFTDLVLKTDMDKTQSQYVNIINQSAKTLLTIVNDILDFSKIEAGKLTLNIERTDLRDLISESCNIISYPLEKKGLHLILEFPDNLPRYIWADHLRLHQVLVNLLSNAVKFTEKGEIKLSIKKLEQLSEDMMILRFEVSDTGVGIRKEKQEEIFGLFEQADNSITKNYGGTGLGLAICNQLLKMGGSTIHLESELGKGSCFSFELKLKAENGPFEDEDLSGIKRVLVVGDNDTNRHLLKHMLELKKIAVEEADNGMTALTMIHKDPKYDVIIMNYQMPIMNGVDVVRKIREITDEDPIIIMYRSPDDENIDEICKELRIKEHLTKPLKIREIYNLLARLTQSKIELQQNRIDRPPADTIKVLIVEDNEINLLLTKVLINQINPNIQISEARNGEEAVKLHDADRPDLILMDLQMPVMNGLEATKNIRLHEDGPTVPIIALTAGNMVGEREKCLEIGMNDFVLKPIVMQTLSNLLSQWLPNHNRIINPAIIENP